MRPERATSTDDARTWDHGSVGLLIQYHRLLGGELRLRLVPDRPQEDAPGLNPGLGRSIPVGERDGRKGRKEPIAQRGRQRCAT